MYMHIHTYVYVENGMSDTLLKVASHVCVCVCVCVRVYVSGCESSLAF